MRASCPAADHCDAFVIGAGPGRRTAARSARLLGLVGHRRAPSGARPAQPRRIASAEHAQAFRISGTTGHPVETAGFHPNDGNVIRVGQRGACDAHVRRRLSRRRAGRSTQSSGAKRSAPARASSTPLSAASTSANPIASTTTATARTFVQARSFSTVRRAPASSRGGACDRRFEARYRTLAIAAEWECPEWPRDERTRTLVESYDDGWAWSVPLSATRRQCTVMVDPRRYAGRALLQRSLRATEIKLSR